MSEPARGPFGHIDIKVAGIPVTLDVDDKLAITDIDADMATVSSDIAFWGDVWSAAQEEATNADAHYRNWRATFTKSLLEEDPKLAEWKVKANIEGHPDFVKWKAAIARAERNVILARAMVDAFDGKRATLQSKGAMLRAELEGTGMSTPTHPKKRPTRIRDEGEDTEIEHEDAEVEDPPLAPMVAPKADKRVDKMRSIFDKKPKG
jgi:hypothetical protein